MSRAGTRPVSTWRIRAKPYRIPTSLSSSSISAFQFSAFQRFPQLLALRTQHPGRRPHHATGELGNPKSDFQSGDTFHGVFSLGLKHGIFQPTVTPIIPAEPRLKTGFAYEWLTQKSLEIGRDKGKRQHT